jgi:CDP-4-dehydro-6-deoxyglucose reductase, E3
LTHNTIQLILKLPDSGIFNFRAGQYINFILKDGKKCSLSLASLPNKNNTLELQIRYVDDGYFTDIIFNKMNIGDLVDIEGPLGDFYLRKNNDRPIILIGGGTGFAPLKGFMEQIISEGLPLDIHFFLGS